MKSQETLPKPLVEAIFEVRWQLAQAKTGLPYDPHFKFLLGKFFDSVKGAYPEHEQLPTASIPDEMVGQNVQHRFRATKNGWPLLQIGPGIMSVNETEGYQPDDFKARCQAAMQALYAAHPAAAELKPQVLTLLYIDAEPFAEGDADRLGFLKQKLGVGLSLPPSLFPNGTTPNPIGLDLRAAFRASDPGGEVSVRITLGKKDGRDALLWHTFFRSAGKDDLPELPGGFPSWLDRAHTHMHNWFMAMIKGENGDLKRKYFGE